MLPPAPTPEVARQREGNQTPFRRIRQPAGRAAVGGAAAPGWSESRRPRLPPLGGGHRSVRATARPNHSLHHAAGVACTYREGGRRWPLRKPAAQRQRRVEFRSDQGTVTGPARQTDRRPSSQGVDPAAEAAASVEPVAAPFLDPVLDEAHFRDRAGGAADRRGTRRGPILPAHRHRHRLHDAASAVSPGGLIICSNKATETRRPRPDGVGWAVARRFYGSRVRRWDVAAPYLLRHCAQHAVDAGRVDELLADAGFWCTPTRPP